MIGTLIWYSEGVEREVFVAAKSAIWIEVKQFQFQKVKTPYPAHRLCAHWMIEHEGHQKWTMVHGFIFKIIGKKTFFRRYAWLEYRGEVFDVAAKKVMKKTAFYKQFMPQAPLAYSYQEVLENMRFFRRYGRWVIDG